MKPEIDAVLFDLDGVLVDSELLAANVWVDLLAEHGLTMNRENFMARAVGTTHAALFDWLSTDHGWQRPDTFTDVMDARLAAAFQAVPAIEGARETLDALNAAGLPFAVASNSERTRLHLKLASAGLAELVGQHAYDPASVGGRGKPQPDLYLHAAAQLGVTPERCVVIEDSATGVLAGVAAGAAVWGLLAGGHAHPSGAAALTAAGASRILHTHQELRAALGLGASV
ncbi:HAD family phosphatase [Deinococcus sp. QL22]|uniref:HAD family hydrolase n=1 Tax=Deinococcus sp. QL22 TaxID=2939437 RepID=UPI0020176EC1|nr:HAD-IA family hydrolase [Deinococcus sp. QL22]UQN05811.1 HAD-IA family hydrolase [Deinococcus sp. QL22]